MTHCSILHGLFGLSSSGSLVAKLQSRPTEREVVVALVELLQRVASVATVVETPARVAGAGVTRRLWQSRLINIIGSEGNFDGWQRASRC